MPLREGLLEPIAGDNPAGQDLRYAPVYDQIKEARREEEEIALSEEGRREIRDVWQSKLKVADWKLTQKLAEEALATKTKDLQIAAWLTEALLRREGFAGLRQGMALMLGLVENFWDHLYPELEDGDSELRAVPLMWVTSHLEYPMQTAAISKAGYGIFKYKEASTVPKEEEGKEDDSKRQKRESAIAEGKLTPEEWDAAENETRLPFLEGLTAELEGLRETVDKLDTLSAEKFGEYAPSFGDMKDTLDEVANVVRQLVEKKGGGKPKEEEVVEEAPDYESAAPAVEERPAEDAAPAARRPARGTQSAEPVDMDDAVQRVAAVARWMREQNPQNPAPYLLLRGLRWGELRSGGSSPEWTLLEAPSTEVRQNLKRLQQEYNFDELLKVSEAAMAMPCGRAWLDLQRFALTACEGAGNSTVAEAIKSGVKALLADYPQLVDMTLTDDTPAANAQTKEFFLERGLTPKPVVEAAPEQAPPEQPAWQAPEQRETVEPGEPDDEEILRQAMRSGRMEEALSMASRKLAMEVSGRARFQRKVQMAQILMSAGRGQVAYPVLKELVQEVDQRHLDQWESPDLIIPPLVLYYRCLDKVGGHDEEKQRVFALVSRLDPVKAFELT
jgi:type VI secretion system protein ImpA